VPDDGKREAARFCPDSPEVDSAVRRDFERPQRASQFVLCTVAVPPKKKSTYPAEEEPAMNVETVELKAVAEVAKTDEAIDLLTLSLDDLDLVAGGSSLGSLL